MPKSEGDLEYMRLIIKGTAEGESTKARGHKSLQPKSDAKEWVENKNNLQQVSLQLLIRFLAPTKHYSENSNSNARKRISKITLADLGNEGLNSWNPHTCCLCQHVFPSHYDLKVHLYICPNIHFTKTVVFKRIIVKKSCDNKKQFACESCDYKTDTQSVLKKQKLVHAEKTECVICHKLVTSLNGHIWAHKSKIPCAACQLFNEAAWKVTWRLTQESRSRNVNIATKLLKAEKTCGGKQQVDEAFIFNLGGFTSFRHNLKEQDDRKLFECHCGSVFARKERFELHKQS